MSDKDAKLVESLARADVRNQFVQKIAAAVASSPVLATNRQKKANDILSRVGGSLRDAAGATKDYVANAAGAAKDYVANADTTQYLNASPVLALALGGAGLGGASALGAGLYSKKKPRRILGHTIGGALAGAALGGGLGAVGHSINRGGTLSSWFRNAKDFVKPKDVAEDQLQDKTVNDKLQQESPALHAAWEKAQRDVEVDNSSANRARLAQLGDLLVKAREYGIKPDPGSAAYPDVSAGTELNTSPFQLGTISGDRDSYGMLSAGKLLQGIDMGAAGISAFNRQLIKHKYSPLSNVDVSKPGVQRWLGERLHATLDSIKSEGDASKRLLRARELLGAPLSVPDEHVKQVIDQMYDRASAVVNNGASVDSMFDDISSGRVAVEPSVASEIGKRWQAANSANAAGFAKQLAGEQLDKGVSLKPKDWTSFWSSGITSKQDAAALQQHLTTLLQGDDATRKDYARIFRGTPLEDMVFTGGGKKSPAKLNIPLVKSMVDYLGLDPAKRQVQDFSYNPSAGLGDSLAKTLGLDKIQLEDLKRMGLLKADGVTLDTDKLKALAGLDPAQLASAGAVLNSGNMTPRADLMDAGRRAHLEQAPHLSYTLPSAVTRGQYNPMKLVDWAVNSRKVPAKALRWGTRFGVLPGMSALTALDSLDQQSKAEVLLKKLDEMDISPEARASLKRRILESQKAVGIKKP